MSRIGREPIAVPAGVVVTIADGNVVTVKGPLGELTQTFHKELTITLDGATLTVARPNDEKENRALHGLTRTLLANMVEGVTKGFAKKLEIVGVGYRAEKQGTKLNLGLGYSHPVVVEPPEGITIAVEANTKVSVKGTNKQLVGDVAAFIRGKRPPEVYKGKGVRYEGEYVRRKAGKTGKK